MIKKDIKKDFFPFLINNLGIIFLFVLLLLGGLGSRHFFTFGNMINLMRQISVIGILACGFGMAFLIGGFDLSQGAVLSLCSVLIIGLMGTAGMFWAFIITIGAGILFGLLNGTLLILVKGGLSETFLITLGTSLVAFSVALTYTGGYTLYFDTVLTEAPLFVFMGQGYIGFIPAPVFFFIALLFILEFFLRKTVFGRSVYLTGGDKKVAFISGIDVRKIKLVTFAISGFCAALAGIILASRTTTGSPRMGEGYEFDACIAIIIGGLKLGGGSGGMFNVFIGSLILGLITNIMNLVGINPVNQIIIKGIILLLVVALDALKVKR